MCVCVCVCAVAYCVLCVGGFEIVCMCVGCVSVFERICCTDDSLSTATCMRITCEHVWYGVCVCVCACEVNAVLMRLWRPKHYVCVCVVYI